MVSSRLATALAGFIASLLLSIALWRAFGTLVFFLIIPFIPFLFRNREAEADQPIRRVCPDCDFATRNPRFAYCPRDGARLEERVD